ncbi:KdsC family phosphatase [Rhodocyclus gracilis]|uniref:3-deoxy-D-manno-octulosonate 8-phosphate phosphatase KdsC n=1 Tax=Rhodocyclus tenuis TaxID=1066 RepID=A0A6L5K153_RHOTE|nr:phenylphosphate carboxylase subunit delta [Rhodocyclus gracilis]MQY52634.1 phenylphosphate carboxylase subunit delta [Rhodocyclus gracilis]
MQAHRHARDCARPLRVMAFDIDGVMTDGTLFFTDEGTELKAFNTLDGLGIKLLQQAGIIVAIITGRRSPCVARRAENLGIEHLFQGIEDKRATLAAFLAEHGIDAAHAGYMGDDIVDLRVMAACGFSAAPGDAHPLAQRQATLVTQRHGGHGAVREVCEFILDAQDRLDDILAHWLPTPTP